MIGRVPIKSKGSVFRTCPAWPAHAVCIVRPHERPRSVAHSPKVFLELFRDSQPQCLAFHPPSPYHLNYSLAGTPCAGWPPTPNEKAWHRGRGSRHRHVVALTRGQLCGGNERGRVGRTLRRIAEAPVEKRRKDKCMSVRLDGRGRSVRERTGEGLTAAFVPPGPAQLAAIR